MDSSSSVLQTSRKRRAIDDPTEATIPTKRTLAELEAKVEPSTSVQSCGPKNITSLDDLSPEIIGEVLERCSTKDLLNFRQVNQKWNEVTSRTLRYRADKVIRFRFEKGHFMNIIKVPCFLVGMENFYQSNSKKLMDLVDCIRNNQNFPFTNFHFRDLSDFENGVFKIFMSIWGEKILSLKITIFDPINGVTSLRKLLLEQVPNLKKLELQFARHGFEVYNSKGSPSTQLFSNSEKFQLPKLQFIAVDKRYRDFRGIVENILSAACNLKEFQTCSIESRNSLDPRAVRDSITIDDFKMLQSLNNFRCVKKFEIFLSKDLITYWVKSAKNMNLKLESLRVSFDEIWNNQELKVAATSMMIQLLESSKDVVKLAMEPLGLLPGVVFPQFRKLEKLELWESSRFSRNPKRAMFPASVEMACVFPNLKELDIRLRCVGDYFLKSPNTVIPSVEVLHISSCEPSVCKLLKITPNVKTLCLASFCYGSNVVETLDFVNGYRDVLSNLTNLETMKWTISGITHKELLFTLDAAVTGLSPKFCKELSKKFIQQDNVSAVELAYIQELREYSSLVDLKALKKFDIHFEFDYDAYCCDDDSDCGDSDCDESDCDESDLESCDSDSEESECKGMWRMFQIKVKNLEDEAGFTKKETLYKTGFTKVSKFLVFDQMPNLKVRIHKMMD